MSLLASEGFGIFNRRHCVVSSDGTCLVFPQGKGTHQIAWALLSHWSKSAAAQDALSASLNPGGRSLSDWLTAFSSGVSAGLIGADLLTTWGLDIQQLSIDRDARNESSYRPTRITNPHQIDPWNSVNYLIGFWEAFEPSNHLRTAQIDRYLLRVILEKVFTAITGRRRDKKEFTARVVLMLRELGLSEATEEWLAFFRREVSPEDPTIISEAKKKWKPSEPWHHIQVLSRAALLLRVASGACANLLQEALISRADLRFWWYPLGKDRGLWSNDGDPEHLSDLWSDIELALDNLSLWTTSNSPMTGERQDLVKALARDVATLSSCELLALWGAVP